MGAILSNIIKTSHDDHHRAISTRIPLLKYILHLTDEDVAVELNIPLIDVKLMKSEYDPKSAESLERMVEWLYDKEKNIQQIAKDSYKDSFVSLDKINCEYNKNRVHVVIKGNSKQIIQHTGGASIYEDFLNEYLNINEKTVSLMSLKKFSSMSFKTVSSINFNQKNNLDTVDVEKYELAGINSEGYNNGNF